MAEINADIVIFGAGIAGLWALDELTKRGYNALLLEKNAIGAGQTIASQGIIHSGLKYKLRGKDAAVAQNIAAMPGIWREKLGGAHEASAKQTLLIPGGLRGKLIKAGVKKAVAGALELPSNEWPENIGKFGFTGSVISIEEPILDMPSVLRALAAPHTARIKKIRNPEFVTDSGGAIEQIKFGGHVIRAKAFIFACAEGNAQIAGSLGHDTGMETQARPLLMGLMRGVPFPLFAHFVGASDKPVATVTTHKTMDGKLVWYVGGMAAERAKDAPPKETYAAAQQAFAHYLPDVDFWNIEWATLPIDRVEKKAARGKMPDSPSVHAAHNALYCWPTKLAFAPLLAGMIADEIGAMQIQPSENGGDWDSLEGVSFAAAPWDTAQWTKFY